VIPKRLLEVWKKGIGKRAKVWWETAIPPGLGKEKKMRPVVFLANILRNNGFCFFFPDFWPLAPALLP
jgi:hypothetical protein